MKINPQTRVLHDVIDGEPFEARPDGTIICHRVNDTLRDEMRIRAAESFLTSREIPLTRSERNHLSAVRLTSKEA